MTNDSSLETGKHLGAGAFAVAALQTSEQSIVDCSVPALVWRHRPARLDRAPGVGQHVEKVSELGGEMLLEVLTHPACESRTGASSGNGDLEIAAPHDRHGKEVAVGNVVDGVDQHTAVPSIDSDLRVEGAILGGAKGQIDPVEIRRLVGAGSQHNGACDVEIAEQRTRLRVDHHHPG